MWDDLMEYVHSYNAGQTWYTPEFIRKSSIIGVFGGGLASLWGIFAVTINPQQIMPWASAFVGATIVVGNGLMMMRNKWQEERRSEAEKDSIRDAHHLQIMAMAQDNATAILGGQRDTSKLPWPGLAPPEGASVVVVAPTMTVVHTPDPDVTR